MAKTDTLVRDLELRFEVFGWRALSDLARAAQQRVEDVLADACAYFVRLLGSNQPPPSPPRFKPADGGLHHVSLSLSADTWAVLEAESARSQVSLERIVEQAAFVYLEASAGSGPGGPAHWRPRGPANFLVGERRPHPVRRSLGILRFGRP